MIMREGEWERMAEEEEGRKETHENMKLEDGEEGKEVDEKDEGEYKHEKIEYDK